MPTIIKPATINLREIFSIFKNKNDDTATMRVPTGTLVIVQKIAVQQIIKDMILNLSLHEKLFLLGIARYFNQTDSAYVSMREAEESYILVCEEYNEKSRGHTQLWKYVKDHSVAGILETMISGAGQRGKTTLISLPRVPASDLEKELVKILS